MQVSIEINNQRYTIDNAVAMHIASLNSQITQLRKECSMKTPAPEAVVQAIPVSVNQIRPFGNKR